MSAPILYCGDTQLTNAAAYLAGLLTHAREEFVYLGSDAGVSQEHLTDELRLVILSDYPAVRMPLSVQSELVSRVTAGVGLLMIGGWESFHGLGGDWDGSPVADALPVEIQPEDDRLNSDRPLLVRRAGTHAVTDGLPWETRPPYVGGLNRLIPRREARVLLEADRLTAVRSGGAWELHADSVCPLLVLGQHGQGRTAALATDVAPHWVGGLVDWGDFRVAAQAPGADPIEVGDLYARFILQLIRWMKGD